MTASSGHGPDGEAEVDGPDGSAGVDGGSGRPGHVGRRERGAAAAVFVGAVAVFSWRVAAASAWRDEAVTQDVAGRSVGQILALTRQVDLVHLAYYLLAHLVHAASGGFVALRLLSAVLFAAAAALTVLIGARLGSLRHGVCAAALVVASPFASSYAQQARPYALTTFLATLSVTVLLGALRSGGTWRWVGYGFAVVGCGLANAVSLLVLLPHAVAVLTVPGSRRALRAAVRTWAVAAGASLLALSGFLAVALRQSGQVDWLIRPTVDRLAVVLTFDLRPWWLLAGLVGLALVMSVLVAPLRRPWLIAASWGFGPVLVLWLVSQVHPIFDGRYVAFCLPGAALALSVPVRVRFRAPVRVPVAVAAGPWREWAVTLIAVVLVAALAFGGWPAQLRVRASSGVEDLRAVAAVLRGHARPGSAVLFVPANYRLAVGMYPDGLPPLRDLSLNVPGRLSATLVGTERPPDVVAAALAREPEVWVVTRDGDDTAHDDVERTELVAVRACFTPDGQWVVRPFAVRHYLRARALSEPCATDSTP